MKILVVGPLGKTWTLPQLAASLCGVWIYADHRHTQYLYSAYMLLILCLILRLYSDYTLFMFCPYIDFTLL